MRKLVVSRKLSRIGLASLAALSALSLASLATAGASDRSSYVLFAPGSESISMNGSMDDVSRARALRQGSEALLYVRHGGSAYVIRDPATLKQAEAIFEPQRALGARQAKLGEQQAELGAQQAKLGAEQARIGARQAAATPRQAEELARQQNELGRRQGLLGEQQGALGEKQGALGRQQEQESRIASGKFQALLSDALRRGIARRID